ncbi:MAG: hypothetical protein GC168_08055 [Candidatus Hydrogenedens sp.]|nr:hypothetical protein [Candidatus Hydrogenedens sp.]
MKSAYERAMEKLEAAAGPAKTLTEAQRAEVADIDSRYDSHEAQARMNFDAKMSQAGTADEVAGLREELARELQRIASDREQAKEAVWAEA